MGNERFTVINAYGLGDEVSLVLFQDDATGERAVQLLPVSAAEVTPELLEWPVPPGEDVEPVTIEVDDGLDQAVQAWCAEWQITFEQVLLALLRFCTDRRYAGIALPWLKETLRAGTGTADWNALPVVTAEELHRDFDDILQRLEDGGGPIRVRCEDQSELVLLHSRDYPGRFSPLSAAEALSANGDTELQKGRSIFLSACLMVTFARCVLHKKHFLSDVDSIYLSFA